MDKQLLNILVCPLCKNDLHYDKAKQELICKADALAYPIREDIPVMLENVTQTSPLRRSIIGLMTAPKKRIRRQMLTT